MTNQTEASRAATRALASAAEWRLLGLLLEQPGSLSTQEIAALAREVDDDALREAAHAVASLTSTDYTTLLGPGGGVSPREVGYRGREDVGRIVGDVAAFYEAFAFKPVGQDPPDHVAVECGFVGYLELKRAYALACGDASRAGMCAEVRDAFIAAHLQRFAEPLSMRLRALEHAALVPVAAALLSRVGPAPSPPSEAPADDAGELRCDACPGMGAEGFPAGPET